MPSNAQPTNPLQKLITRILRWVRRHIGLEAVREPGVLEGASDNATLWRVSNTEPGNVVCYWLCHRFASADLVISLISLAQLREDAALKHSYQRSTDPIRITGRRPFSDELAEYLESQGGLDSRFISHIFVVVWRSKVPRQGHEQRGYLVRPLAAIPADLQGASFAWASGDRYACRIVEAIARKLLKVPHDSTISWEKRINKIDWIAQIDYCARTVFGDSHRLQPTKYRDPK